MRALLPIAVLAMASTVGCVFDEDYRPNVAMEASFVAPDFASDFEERAWPESAPDRRAVLGIMWTGYVDTATWRAADEYFVSHIQLVSLETGARVAGHGVIGMARTNGAAAEALEHTRETGGAYSFVPDAPLTDGWYVLLVDAAEWSNHTPFVAHDPRGVLEDDTLYQRVHVGVRPTWYATYTSCSELGDRPGCIVSAELTDPVDVAPSSFELLVNGALDPSCTDSVGAGYRGWECPLFPEGTTVEVRLVAPGSVEVLDVTSQRLTTPFGASRTPTAPRFGIDVALAAL